MTWVEGPGGRYFFRGPTLDDGERYRDYRDREPTIERWSGSERRVLTCHRGGLRFLLYEDGMFMVLDSQGPIEVGPDEIVSLVYAGAFMPEGDRKEEIKIFMFDALNITLSRLSLDNPNDWVSFPDGEILVCNN